MRLVSMTTSSSLNSVSRPPFVMIAAKSAHYRAPQPRTAWRRWRSLSPRQHACTATTAAAAAVEPQAALEWLTDACGRAAGELRVERRLTEGAGWGLVATEEVEPGEVLLSVPLTLAITSEGADESEWSIAMAQQLLSHLAQGSTSPVWPWIEALPRHVPLPWLYFSAEEREAIQDLNTLAECSQLESIYEAACQACRPHSREEVAWALSIIHSRSFLYNGVHVFVPGIDFCNHSPSPSAEVRCVRPLSQGAAAEEEVTGVPPPPEPSRFELVVGEEGIGPGEEVTISYGRWPNDVMLLFFGFTPADNDSDSVVLFQGLADLALSWHEMMTARSHASGGRGAGGTVGGSIGGTWAGIGEEEVQQRVMQLWKEALQRGVLAMGEDYSRLVVTASGFDGRLFQAAAVLEQLYPAFFAAQGGTTASADGSSGQGSDEGSSSGGSSGGDNEGSGEGSTNEDSEGTDEGSIEGMPPLQELLTRKCRELLGSYPTTYEEDAAWLEGARDAGASDNMRSAVTFRLGKKAILLAALAHLEGQ